MLMLKRIFCNTKGLCKHSMRFNQINIFVYMIGYESSRIQTIKTFFQIYFIRLAIAWTMTKRHTSFVQKLKIINMIIKR
jgi:hypothetical protein